MSLAYSNNLLLIGNSGVGKSCMLMQYSENEFSTNFYNTIGVDFKIKSQEIEGKQIKLQIWDTAGQDRTITCSYYRGAHGIIIVYDVTDKESFENVKTWMVEIDKYAQENVNKILVGNKCDLSDKRAVSYEEGEELAQTYNIPFMEASAKSAYNIQECFDDLAKNVMKRISVSAKPFRTQNGIKLGQKKETQKQTDDFNIDNCCK